MRCSIILSLLLCCVESIRVPAPLDAFASHQVWDSTVASCLKNSTQTLWNSTQEAYARLRQHRAQWAPPPPHPSSTDDVICHAHHGGTGDDDDVNADDDEEFSLTEYLARLEQRLADMEQERAHSMEAIHQQQQYILALQEHQRHQHEQLALSSQETNVMVQRNRDCFAIFDTLRLFVVTAVPVVVFGTLLGMALIGFTHLLALILEISHPIVQSMIRKTQQAMLVSAQFVVDALGGSGTPSP